jgi:hypothetical protein
MVSTLIGGGVGLTLGTGLGIGMALESEATERRQLLRAARFAKKLETDVAFAKKILSGETPDDADFDEDDGDGDEGEGKKTKKGKKAKEAQTNAD